MQDSQRKRIAILASSAVLGAGLPFELSAWHQDAALGGLHSMYALMGVLGGALVMLFVGVAGRPPTRSSPSLCS